MKEFKGTPGSWEIEDDNPYLPCFDIVSDCEETYISVYTITEEAIHNARLIAAAPELFDLIVSANLGATGSHTAAWQQKAQSAIKKALGESK